MNNYISVAILIAIGVALFILLLVGDTSVFSTEMDKNMGALQYLSEKV